MTSLIEAQDSIAAFVEVADDILNDAARVVQ